jgi:tetratricopeptide (TPR) repeat protein
VVVARCLTVWMATLVACAEGTAVDPVIACRDAARAHRPEALGDCAAVFAQTGSPVAGGGLARALLDNHAPERLEALALDVGDRGGADAWAAVGDAHDAAGDHAAAIAAYKRALAHRGGDDWGAARDAYALC